MASAMSKGELPFPGPHGSGPRRAPLLENGARLQLEGDLKGGFLCRRKGPGSLLGTVVLLPGRKAVFEAICALTGAERRELAWLVRRIAPSRRSLALRGDQARFRAMPLLATPCAPPPLPRVLAALGLELRACLERGLPFHREPARLRFVGRDRSGRAHWLVEPAAEAFLAMRAAAHRDGIALEIVSSFRSILHQAEIFRRKLARGIPLERILEVNAPPGFSEHHSGRALDLGAPGCPPAEEVFEETAAFRWLAAHAQGFGFRMSYPRGNPYGFVYEPWHWCWSSGP